MIPDRKLLRYTWLYSITRSTSCLEDHLISHELFNETYIVDIKTDQRIVKREHKI